LKPESFIEGILDEVGAFAEFSKPGLSIARSKLHPNILGGLLMEMYRTDEEPR
jgi:hypothetical protein